MAFRIVTLGDLVADLTVLVRTLPLEIGQYQEAHSIRIEPGGAGNFLITGSRLGMTMVAAGALGDDAFGHAVGATLFTEGVHMELVCYPPHSITTAVLVLNDDAGNTIMIGAYGSGPALEYNSHWKEAINSADAVFAFGYSLREFRIQSAVLEALEHAQSIGCPILFDPGPEFHLLESAVRARALSTTQVLLLTDSELAIMGAGSPQELMHQDSIVVVKCGAAGCYILNEVGTITVPSYPVKVKDVAGAGDCFAAAFVYGYLSGWTLRRTAIFANATGAAKVQKRGTGRQAPNLDEVHAILANYEPSFNF